ncbi:MAG: two-component sensor histidine kinase [Xanthomarina sp.]|uniref:histidine kinase n=1 Tax=Xanthomarina gelatinilytica TaxID=1137281 RepID=A0A3D6BVV7_9FLAO|nr:HAMP domain-containing sensor histidine kinase [Xanthomarina sp.]MAL22211.1 two-component sensor histidine kinase [Xanthomarina sp.]MBF60749.1 two-component sensor histidine kinase [Xanthomarina sp.]HCY82827.1 two-component sensor histidine kinase [Xanthomarina gelatinilytica]|tara:strand:+ start:230 stop:1396 length:1167 start_codon:yes stop_codon:yes gene_type:complete
MLFSKYRHLTRWIIVVASFGIISLILWNTYVFFQKFKIEEQSKLDIWAAAYQEINSNPLDENVNPLVDKVFTSEITNPMFVYHDGSVLISNNIDETILKEKASIDKLITQYSQENKPIVISYEDNITKQTVIYGTLYYGNSEVLNKLKYYPLALLLIIILFGAVVYFFYRSSKIATQNKLWSGMAKETAHQIGTPLSSLIGWTEILKSEQVNPEYIKEIEKDIARLQTITERFSKIGSLPTLEKADIVKETIDSYDYLKARSSKLIDFELITPSEEIYVNLNKQLYSWTIENLVKNAIDAMRGKGKLTIEISQLEDTVKINVSDTGKGLSKNQFQAIFEPGYTTKKRGWGLGLSLAKRIIEEFHGGKIRVIHSEIDKGTTMQISLKSI